MPLRAQKPEAVNKRLKLFMFGPAGVGKTTAAIQFPYAYIIDTEKGAENYSKVINSAGGVVFHTTDIHETIAEVKALLTEKHEYRTLVIDPITPLYQDLLDKSEQKVGSDFGRHYGAANKIMKRLINLIMRLDMNVVITSHAKNEYGPGLVVVGKTFDAWKQIDYMFDLVLELTKVGKGAEAKRYGNVIKTRLATFPDGDTFEWSYKEVARRAGATEVERRAATVALATPEQLAEMRTLLDTVKLPEDWTEKVFSKAGVDDWADMPGDKLQACVDQLRKKIGK